METTQLIYFHLLNKKAIIRVKMHSFLLFTVVRYIVSSFFQCVCHIAFEVKRVSEGQQDCRKVMVSRGKQRINR